MAKKLPLFGREKFLREQAKEKERKENEKRKLKEKQKRQRRKAKEKVRKLKQKQKKQSKQRQKINDVRINPDTRDVKQLKDILRKMKKRIDSDIRKLLDEVRKTGNISPPALDDLLNTGGRISTKGDNYDDLYREYLRGKKFLEDDTHTLKGYRDFIKGIDDVMVDEFGDDWYDAGYNDSDNEFSKEEQTERYWEAFEIVKDQYPQLFEDRAFVSGLIEATQERCVNSRMMLLQEMVDVLDAYCQTYKEMTERHRNEAHHLY